jgi:gluconate 2-dehydrogenase gamma chain
MMVNFGMASKLPVWNPKRRRFLRAAATAAAGGAVSCSGSKSSWRFFTAEEAATAAAIAECLIPTDEWPGAAWAGAAVYMDRQLHGHFRKHRGAYREGLAAIDEASRAACGRRFTEAGAEQQVRLLELVEKGKAAAPRWPAAAQRQFFSLILSHTMQSYYGDPRHGGNRDQVGYRMLGIPVTPVRGREHHDLTAGERS